MKYAEKIIFAYIFIIGCAFALLVPPLQKPDEHGHFKRAFFLSRGYLMMLPVPGRLPIDRQTNDLLENKHLNSLAFHPERKLDLKLYDKPVFADETALKNVWIENERMFVYSTIPYIPHALGLILARCLQLNAYLSFFMGRGSAFIFLFLWMIMLYKKTPRPYSFILLLVFSLPMVIHQISAYTYDGAHYLFSFTLFSLFIHLMMKKQISTRELFMFAAVLLLFIMSKMTYEPMALLLFLIPRYKISKSLKNYILKISAVLVLMVAVYVMAKLPFFIASSSYNSYLKGVSPLLQALYILHNPIRYVWSLVLSTVLFMKFHLQGVVGIFGWLDYSLDPWLYFVWIAATFSIIYHLKPLKPPVPWRQISFLFIILIMNYVYILTFFYLTWNTVGSLMITGTQGRYFIPFVPYFIYGIIQLKQLKSK